MGHFYKGSRTKFSGIILAVIFAVLGAFSSQHLPQNSEASIDCALEVTFIDVGQGDSILFKTKAGKTLLVDGGETQNANGYLMPTLDEKGATVLDYALLTHFHSDHMGGIEELVKQQRVKNLILPAVTANTKKKSSIIKAANKAGTNVIEISRGQSFPFELEGGSISVLSPNLGKAYENENNNSVVLKVVFGKTVLLLTGDIEEEVEMRLVEEYDLECDILKVAHHGSVTSTTKAFLEEANPTYGVIQCGKGNSYGHPHYETMMSLMDEDVLIYRTDEDKNITLYFDEVGLKNIRTQGRSSGGGETLGN